MRARIEAVVARAALLFLAFLVLLCVFADVIASDAPLLASTRGRLQVFANVTHSANPAPDWAVWPPIRFSPQQKSQAGPFAGPSTSHPLGTDAFGHDVASVVVHGARSVVVTSLAVLAFAIALGVALGVMAGHGSQLPDAVLSRAIELSSALPTLVLLALLRAGSIIPSWLGFVLIVAVLRSLEIARLVRGEVLRVGGTDYVLAAQALGGTSFGIARRHLLPHVVGPVLISAAFTAASVVALEAALAFVGLGHASDQPSWGMLLGQARQGLGAGALFLSGLAIVATTASLYVVAEVLDDRICARRGGPSRV
jgi:peptide/nickel transport system permease protein